MLFAEPLTKTKLYSSTRHVNCPFKLPTLGFTPFHTGHLKQSLTSIYTLETITSVIGLIRRLYNVSQVELFLPLHCS